MLIKSLFKNIMNIEFNMLNTFLCFQLILTMTRRVRYAENA